MYEEGIMPDYNYGSTSTLATLTSYVDSLQWRGTLILMKINLIFYHFLHVSG